MIIKYGHPLFRELELVDIFGNKIENVYHFNTKTETVKMYVTAVMSNGGETHAISGESITSEGNKAVTVSFKLKGAKLRFKETGIGYYANLLSEGRKS